MTEFNGEDFDILLFSKCCSVGNIIFVPQMNIASDIIAIEQLQNIYSGCEIVPVEVDGVVKKGGALNCISWNLKE